MFAETLREIILQKVVEMREIKRTHWVGTTTLAILMIPLISMQFSNEIKWTVFDFAVAGTALFLTGSAFAFVTRTSTNWTYKSAAALALIATLFHFWANGAVGMIGSERDNFNGLYHVIPFVGLIGATLAQLEARMMTRVMSSMAGVHVAIGLLALLLDKHAGSMRAALEIIGVTGMFAVLFLTSAWLFQRSTAGRSRREPNA